MNELKYEVTTDKTFLEAIQAVTEELKKRQFGVLCEINFKDKLLEKNITFENNFKVLEVCNPFKANQVLSKHLEVGYFLPCKLAIYEKDDQVRMGFIDPQFFIKMVDDQELNDVALEIYQVLKESIDAAK